MEEFASNTAENLKIKEQLEGEDLVKQVIQTAKSDLLAFCLLLQPDFMVGPHHLVMSNFLMDIFHGKIKRGLLFLPPRSSKSFMSSFYFPAFILGHHPHWQTIMLSHTMDLANDFSREIRNLLSNDMYRAIFPNITLRPDSRAANRWHTNKNGVFVSAGAGSSIAGRGANIAILDDPLSEQTATSKADRERLNRWFTPGLRSRLAPNGRILLTNTRWNSNDLSGFLMKQAKDNPLADTWELLKIPAILEDDEVCLKLQNAREELIERGILPEEYPKMRPGESYWPPIPGTENSDVGLRGWTTDELLRTKASSSTQYWTSLYQQEPVAEEGNILRIRDWRWWEEDKPPDCEFILMSMDTAFSTSDRADYSAIQVWGIFKDVNGVPNMILLAAEKGRWAYPELREKSYEWHLRYLPDSIIIEKKASGQSLIQELRLKGLPVWDYDPGDKDKVARAHAVTPILQAGRVWVPKGKQWADEIVHECASFPSGEHDDNVDCFTQACLYMRQSYQVSLSDDWHPDEEYDSIRKVKRYYA